MQNAVLRASCSFAGVGVVQELWGGDRDRREPCGKAQLQFFCPATGIAFHLG